MNCKDVGELLISYLDGELTKEEKEIVELHLSACPRCRGELESLSATQNQLRHSFATVANKAPSPQAWVKLQQQLAVENHPRVTIIDRAKSQLRKAAKIVSKGLSSRQPVWKPLAGALAVVLVAGLVLTIPPFLGQSQEILAADIVQNDPQVYDLLPEGTDVRVTKIVKPGRGSIFHVSLVIPSESIWGVENGSEAIIIEALVDVHERKVLELKAVSSRETLITPLSVVEKERAMEIAKADSRVQEILNNGAEIRQAIPLPFFRQADSSVTGNVVGVVLVAHSADSRPKKLPGWKIQKWIVAVDLDNEKVVRITETPA